jgi:DNA replicative helicase MCM subunit Mcm2 (Cdc46/Mcm family)
MEITPENHRAKWTNIELKQLLRRVKDNMDINEIANIHMRTVGAIKYKLIRYAIECSERNPNLSLKKLAEITNLSIEDLRNGFEKLHYDFEEVPEEEVINEIANIQNDIYMTKLEKIEYRINLIGFVISTYFICILLLNAYL